MNFCSTTIIKHFTATYSGCKMLNNGRRTKIPRNSLFFVLILECVLSIWMVRLVEVHCDDKFNASDGDAKVINGLEDLSA